MIKAEVSEHVELAQVLLYLTGAQDRTVQHLENKYYVDSIERWFSHYRTHPAVIETRRAVYDNSFFHIKPLRAVLDIACLLDNDCDPLHTWAVLAMKFAADSSFDGFFNSQRDYYSLILDKINSRNIEIWISFVENYFGGRPDEFHLIICPIAGNYGFRIRNSAYTVRCMPMHNEKGEPIWQFDFLAKGVAHEYAHCFVNPIVEANKEILGAYKDFFAPHKSIPSAYNTDYAVINEYFVRAFQIRFMEENRRLFPEFDIDAEYRRLRSDFIFIDSFVGLLREYEKSDGDFQRFYEARIDDLLYSLSKKQ